MNSSFWKDRRVFLTGHTGFKGSWLAIWLHHLNAKVAGYALAPPTSPSLFDDAKLQDKIYSHYGDILDAQNLARVIETTKPEIIIHMAAQSLVRPSYLKPVETYATNVMGTLNVLEAARHISGIRAVICVTSDKCYDNRALGVPFSETDPMGGYDPYSSSKGAAELIISAYRSSFFHPLNYDAHRVALASVRSGNVIGGGDYSSERLVPDLLSAIRNRQSARIRNPSSIRPWQHVLDPLHGYLVLAERLVEDGKSYAEGWNFGPEEADAKPVKWIADRLCALWGDQARWQTDDKPSPHEAEILRLNIDKSRHRLNWHPRLTVDQALQWVVEWEKERQADGGAYDQTRAQIKQFEQIL